MTEDKHLTHSVLPQGSCAPFDTHGLLYLMLQLCSKKKRGAWCQTHAVTYPPLVQGLAVWTPCWHQRESTYPTHHRRVVAVWPGLPGTLTFTSQPGECYLLPWVLVMVSGLHAARQRWGGGTQHLPSLLLSIALFYQPEEVSEAGPVPQSQQTLAGTHSPDQVCTSDRPANCWTEPWHDSLHAPLTGPKTHCNRGGAHTLHPAKSYSDSFSGTRRPRRVCTKWGRPGVHDFPGFVTSLVLGGVFLQAPAPGVK